MLGFECQMLVGLTQKPTYVGKCCICLLGTIVDISNDDLKPKGGLPLSIQLFKLFILGTVTHMYTSICSLTVMKERGIHLGKK